MQVLAVELEHLPTDLLVSIASLCDLYSIQQLSLVNKFFCSLCKNDRLWKHLLDKLEPPKPTLTGGYPDSYRSAVLKALRKYRNINTIVFGTIYPSINSE